MGLQCITDWSSISYIVVRISESIQQSIKSDDIISELGQLHEKCNDCSTIINYTAQQNVKITITSYPIIFSITINLYRHLKVIKYLVLNLMERMGRG